MDVNLITFDLHREGERGKGLVQRHILWTSFYLKAFWDGDGEVVFIEIAKIAPDVFRTVGIGCWYCIATMQRTDGNKQALPSLSSISLALNIGIYRDNCSRLLNVKLTDF